MTEQANTADRELDTDVAGRAESTCSAAPWQQPPLDRWGIVGMNHYRIGSGARQLYVAMVRNGVCITAEGPDDNEIWATLRRKSQ